MCVLTFSLATSSARRRHRWWGRVPPLQEPATGQNLELYFDFFSSSHHLLCFPAGQKNLDMVMLLDYIFRDLGAPPGGDDHVLCSEDCLWERKFNSGWFTSFIKQGNIKSNREPSLRCFLFMWWWRWSRTEPDAQKCLLHGGRKANWSTFEDKCWFI